MNLVSQNSWIVTSYHKNQISVLSVFISQGPGKIWQYILFKRSHTSFEDDKGDLKVLTGFLHPLQHWACRLMLPKWE